MNHTTRWRLQRKALEGMCALGVLLAAGTSFAVSMPPGSAAPASWDDRLLQLELRADLGKLDARWGDDVRLLEAQADGDATRLALVALLRCSYVNDIDATDIVAKTERQQRDAARDGDARREAVASLCLSYHYAEMGTEGLPARAREQAVDAAERSGDKTLLALALARHGSLLSLQGELARAVDLLLRAESLYAQLGLPRRGDALLNDIGAAYRRLGDFDMSEHYLKRGLEAMLRAGEAVNANLARMQLGFLALNRRRLDDARAHFTHALREAQAMSMIDMSADCHWGLAEVAGWSGDGREAIQQAEAGRQVMQKAGRGYREADWRYRRGWGRLLLKEHEAALQDLNVAVDRWRSHGLKRYLTWALELRAQAHEALGRPDAALKDVKELLALKTEINARQVDQQTLLMRNRFDASQRELENRRLKAERDLQAQALAAAETTRRWQGLVAVMSAVLALCAIGYAWMQVVRSRRLRRMSESDPLTGVLNRRGMDEVARRAFVSSRMRDEALTALMIDIDHFKAINDRHGHPAGDVVLQRVAHALGSGLRQRDRLARVGGEEFMVVLPGADETTAQHVGERLRLAVAALSFDDLAARLTVTVSYGVAAMRPEDGSADAMKVRADQALYRAKQAGRNCGVAWRDDSDDRTPLSGAAGAGGEAADRVGRDARDGAGGPAPA